MPAILNYLLHLVTAGGLVVAFFVIYTWITPFDEVALIRAGNSAASLSLGGALVGFSFTVASALFHTAEYTQFLMWAGIGMVVQVLVYVVTTVMLKMAQDQIEANNVSFGGLLGAISLSIGLVNAGAIS